MKQKHLSLIVIATMVVLTIGCCPDGCKNGKKKADDSAQVAQLPVPACDPSVTTVCLYVLFGKPASFSPAMMVQAMYKKTEHTHEAKKVAKKEDSKTIAARDSMKQSMRDMRFVHAGPWGQWYKIRAAIDSNGGSGPCDGKGICQSSTSATALSKAICVTFKIDQRTPGVMTMSFSLNALRTNQPGKVSNFADQQGRPSPAGYPFDSEYDLNNIFGDNIIFPGGYLGPDIPGQISINGDVVTVTYTYGWDLWP